MKSRNITVTLEKAREWYNSCNATLKEIALQAFSKEELDTYTFTKIKTFEDAVNAIAYTKAGRDFIKAMADKISTYSTTCSAMFKVNIIRKALNKGYNMHLTRNAEGQDYTWYPRFELVTEDCIYCIPELRKDILKKIGEITSEGVTYNVLGGDACHGNSSGLGYFYSDYGVNFADACIGLLGCATEDIAKHFGKYFGMLITEALYGDLPNTQIK